MNDDVNDSAELSTGEILGEVSVIPINVSADQKGKFPKSCIQIPKYFLSKGLLDAEPFRLPPICSS